MLASDELSVLAGADMGEQQRGSRRGRGAHAVEKVGHIRLVEVHQNALGRDNGDHIALPSGSLLERIGKTRGSKIDGHEMQVGTLELQRFDSRTFDLLRRWVVDFETLHVGKLFRYAECECVEPGADDQKLTRPFIDGSPSFIVHEALANRKRHHLPGRRVACDPVGEASKPRFAVQLDHPRFD